MGAAVDSAVAVQTNAMAYLRQVAVAFVGIGVAAGLRPKFQIGEPWWWTMPDGGHACTTPAAVAALAPVGDSERA